MVVSDEQFDKLLAGSLKTAENTQRLTEALKNIMDANISMINRISKLEKQVTGLKQRETSAGNY